MREANYNKISVKEACALENGETVPMRGELQTGVVNIDVSTMTKLKCPSTVNLKIVTPGIIAEISVPCIALALHS